MLIHVVSGAMGGVRRFEYGFNGYRRRLTVTHQQQHLLGSAPFRQLLVRSFAATYLVITFHLV